MIWLTVLSVNYMIKLWRCRNPLFQLFADLPVEQGRQMFQINNEL